MDVERVDEWVVTRRAALDHEDSSVRMSDAGPAIQDMLTIAKMWRDFRREFPELAVTPEVISVLQEGCDARHLLAASEFPRGEWVGGGEASVAAARLASMGKGEDVLIASALLTHGYDYCGGGVALCDGYLMLLPAIVSALSPDTLWTTDALDIPPCWGADEYDLSVELNHDARVLRPGASMGERRAAAHAPDATTFSPGHPSYEEAWHAREIAARALGLEPARIWSEVLTDSPEFSWARLVDAAEAWDQNAIDQLHYASLLYWIGSESQQLLDEDLFDASNDRIVAAFPWTEDWHVSAFDWPQAADRYSLKRWFGRKLVACSREALPWRLGNT